MQLHTAIERKSAGEEFTPASDIELPDFRMVTGAVRGLRAPKLDQCKPLLDQLVLTRKGNRYVTITPDQPTVFNNVKLYKDLCSAEIGLGSTFSKAQAEPNSTLGQAVATLFHTPNASRAAVYKAWCRLFAIYSNRLQPVDAKPWPQNRTPSKTRLVLAAMVSDPRLSPKQQARACEELADSYLKEARQHPNQAPYFYREAFVHLQRVEHAYEEIRSRKAHERTMAKLAQVYRHVKADPAAKAPAWLVNKIEHPLIALIALVEDSLSSDAATREAAMKDFLLRGYCAYLVTGNQVTPNERHAVLASVIDYTRQQQQELAELMAFVLQIEHHQNVGDGDTKQATHQNVGPAVGLLRKITALITQNKCIDSATRADIYSLKTLCQPMPPAPRDAPLQTASCSVFPSLAAGYASFEQLFTNSTYPATSELLVTLIQLYAGQAGEDFAAFWDNDSPHSLAHVGLKTLCYQVIENAKLGTANADHCRLAEDLLMQITQAPHLTPLDSHDVSNVHGPILDLQEAITLMFHAIVRADETDDEKAVALNARQKAVGTKLRHLFYWLRSAASILTWFGRPDLRTLLKLSESVEEMLALPPVKQSPGFTAALQGLSQLLTPLLTPPAAADPGDAKAEEKPAVALADITTWIQNNLATPLFALLQAYDSEEGQHFFNTPGGGKPQTSEVRAYITSASFAQLTDHFHAIAAAIDQHLIDEKAEHFLEEVACHFYAYWFQAPVNEEFRKAMLTFFFTLRTDKQRFLTTLLDTVQPTHFPLSAAGNDTLLRLSVAIRQQARHAPFKASHLLQMGTSFLGIKGHNDVMMEAKADGNDPDPQYRVHGFDFIRQGLLTADDATPPQLIAFAADGYSRHHAHGRHGGLDVELAQALTTIARSQQVSPATRAILQKHWQANLAYNGLAGELGHVVRRAKKAWAVVKETLQWAPDEKEQKSPPIHDLPRGTIALEQLSDTSAKRRAPYDPATNQATYVPDPDNFPLLKLVNAGQVLKEAINQINLPQGSQAEVVSKVTHILKTKPDVISVLALIADGSLPIVTSEELLGELSNEVIDHGHEIVKAYHWLMSFLYVAFYPGDKQVTFYDRDNFFNSLCSYMEGIPAGQEALAIAATFQTAEQVRRQPESHVLDDLLRDGFRAPVVPERRFALGDEKGSGYGALGTTEPLQTPLLDPVAEDTRSVSEAGSYQGGHTPTYAGEAADDQRPRRGCWSRFTHYLTTSRPWRWLAGSRGGQITRTAVSAGAAYGSGAGIGCAIAGSATTAAFLVPAVVAAPVGYVAYHGPRKAWNNITWFARTEPGKFTVGVMTIGGSVAILVFVVGGSFFTITTGLCVTASALSVGGIVPLAITDSPSFEKCWRNGVVRIATGVPTGILAGFGTFLALQTKNSHISGIDKYGAADLLKLELLPISTAAAFVGVVTAYIFFNLWRPREAIVYAPEHRESMPYLSRVERSGLRQYEPLLAQEVPDFDPPLEAEDIAPPPSLTKSSHKPAGVASQIGRFLGNPATDAGRSATAEGKRTGSRASVNAAETATAAIGAPIFLFAS